MIWHFFEVWALMLAAFAVGGVIGAQAYAVLARSPLAGAQGAVADAVGDLVDSVKTRLGVGPVWRPEYRRVAGRAVVAADGELDPGAFAFPDRSKPDNGRQLRGSDAVAALPAPAETPLPLPLPDSLPPPAETFEAEPAEEREAIVPMRPAGLSTPRNGVPDNLQRIRGVGERNEALLNSLGIFHFGQIAAWTPGEVRWVGAYLAFPERIERDDWVGQATILATGGDTGFVKAAERRRARRQQQFDETAADAPDDDTGEATGPDDR